MTDFPNYQNNPAGAIPVYVAGSASNVHIATNTGTLVKTGAGSLGTVTVNTAGTGSTVTLYDNTAGSGTVLAIISTTAQVSLSYNIAFTTGLYAVTAGSGAADITIGYA